MSANLCLMAWNEPIGTPNCSRCLAYSSVMSKIGLAGADHLERERDGRLLDARRRPAATAGPGVPSTRSAPTRTSPRSMVARTRRGVERVDGRDARRRRAGPRTRRSRRRPHRRRGAPGTRATTTISSTVGASITACFTPLSTKRVAVGRGRGRDRRRVVAPARLGDRERAGDRALGDGAEEAGAAGPASPSSRTAGTNWETVGRSGTGAIARPSSSTTTASSTAPSPRPPYCLGDGRARASPARPCGARASLGGGVGFGAASPTTLAHEAQRALARSTRGRCRAARPVRSVKSSSMRRGPYLTPLSGPERQAGCRRVGRRRSARAPRAPAVDLLPGGQRERLDDDAAPRGACSRRAASRACSRSSSSVGGRAGSRGTTTATPISPITGSGRGTTATAATSGWADSTASTSTGYTLYPPRTYISLLRPTSRRRPRSSTQPRSPVRTKPSAVNASRVASGVAPVARHHGGGAQAHARRPRRRRRRRSSSSSTASSTAAWGRPTLTIASSSGSSNAVPRPMPASVHE